MREQPRKKRTMNLHSTMYLLNLFNPVDIMSVFPEFTFHYVSIKSTAYTPNTDIVLKFTFHYVSIKSQIKTKASISNVDLHSTMYLLNLDRGLTGRRRRTNLHSTMYLLNLRQAL